MNGATTGLYFAHATGFCKEVWEPLIGCIDESDMAADVISWDSAAHGESDAGEPPYDWWSFGRDALSVAGVFDHRYRVGIGHSMGGATLAMAEVLHPGTFDLLVLIEPITFPPPYGRFNIPLADIALRRRRVFPSLEAARDNFADKYVFEHWIPAAVDAYVAGGLADIDGELALRCSPEHEAEVYLGGSAHGAFDQLDEIEVPTLLVAGEHSTTHNDSLMTVLHSRFPNGSVAIVENAGHFVPMEQPAVVARLILSFIKEKGPAEGEPLQ